MSTKFNIENNKDLKRTPFKVPEGYFESMESKLQGITKNQSKVIELKPQSSRIKWLSLAATLLILVSAVWYVNRNSVTTELDLTSEEVMALIENGYINYSETAVLDMVTIEDLEEVEFDGTDVYEYYETMQPELIEEYYLFEDI